MKSQFWMLRRFSPVVALIFLSVLLVTSCATTSIPLVFEPDLEALADRLARDIVSALNPKAGTTIEVELLDALSDEDFPVAVTVSGALTKRLADRAPQCMIFFSMKESEAMTSRNPATEDRESNRIRAESKSRNSDVVVGGSIEVHRETVTVTIKVRRPGSFSGVFTTSRQAIVNEDFVRLSTMPLQQRDEEPENGPPEKKDMIHLRVLETENGEDTSEEKHLELVEVPEPSLETHAKVRKHLFAEDASVETIIGAGGSFGYYPEIAWLAGGYLRRLNTEFPLSAGLWLGLGFFGPSPFPVGGLKLVIGEKSEGFAGSINLGFVPSFGLYFRNFTVNIMFLGSDVFSTEIGYSFDLH